MPSSSLIIHLPHDSTVIPQRFRNQFVLNDDELAEGLLAMTDAHTAALFHGLCPQSQEIRFPVSRLLVDVERFADDAQEVMASKGMGVIYTHTSRCRPLRRPLDPEERRVLLDEFYHPHHRHFTDAVGEVLHCSGGVLVLDAHSFSAKPQPSALDQNPERPDICIGTDPFHTPGPLCDAFVNAFVREGFTVRVNVPYAGAIVPSTYYRREKAVRSVMVEINRKLYMNEEMGTRLPEFNHVAEKFRDCCGKAIERA